MYVTPVEGDLLVTGLTSNRAVVEDDLLFTGLTQQFKVTYSLPGLTRNTAAVKGDLLFTGLTRPQWKVTYSLLA